jgi:hypothetical protein
MGSDFPLSSINKTCPILGFNLESSNCFRPRILERLEEVNEVGPITIH